jgi:dienelactone hydrolase
MFAAHLICNQVVFKIRFRAIVAAAYSALVVLPLIAGCRTQNKAVAPVPRRVVSATTGFVFETHSLDQGGVPITLNLAFTPGTVPRHPVILMLGSLQTNRLPDWSTNLVREGYMLAAFSAAYAPDPDPARRPQWLYFDQRFAHSYVLGAQRAITDSRRVLEYLAGRGDVNPEKLGWLGSSSTGIPGLAVATQGPRLAAVVAFVSTGAYRQWFDTWQPNGLWHGTNYALWPETDTLLSQYDPIRHATNLFPTATLLVSGGDDKVVDAKTARAFVASARPAFQSDPDRLRLVVYDGSGHNLPVDVVRLYAEHWFHLYMNPTGAPPNSTLPARTLEQSVVRSQINAGAHRDIMGAPAVVAAPKLGWLGVSKDRRGFVHAATGKPFTPWGFNYDRDYKSRLLEDYWESEWPTVVEDFHEMKALGANVVRIHLRFNKFMDGPARPNQESLAQLARLAKLAEETDLYLDITGLGCYRKSEVPAWYNSLDESARWKAQAVFWQAIASKCAPSPAIFCYDLMNEPIVPGGKRAPGDWMTGDLGGFSYCQFISLDQAGRSRPEIARQWITKLAKAIRRRDTRHLVTVGMLPDSVGTSDSISGFVPQKVEGSLDFLCVHLYPKSGHLEDDLKLLRGFNVGKPVVIEEMFPLTCSATELGEFIRRSQPDAAGWLGFYWGQTPEELSHSTNLGDILTREWLKLFQELRVRESRAGAPLAPD